MSDASGPQSQGNPSRGNRPEGVPGRSPEDSDYAGASAVPEPLSSSEDRQWAMLAHFGGILGFVPSLLIYLVFKDRGPFTAQESKEALNFTLPPTLVAVAANLLSLVPWVGGVFAVLAALIWIAIAVFSVKAGVQVNHGQPYRYRYNLRWIK